MGTRRASKLKQLSGGGGGGAALKKKVRVCCAWFSAWQCSHVLLRLDVRLTTSYVNETPLLEDVVHGSLLGSVAMCYLG